MQQWEIPVFTPIIAAIYTSTDWWFAYTPMIAVGGLFGMWFLTEYLDVRAKY